MAPNVDDLRRRTLEAVELIAGQYGVDGQLAELRTARVWEPLAVAMLAEAVAALLIEVRPPSSAARRNGHHASR